jgi:hypothetical protein
MKRQSAAKKAAVRYVGYHESLCGDGRTMVAFEDGYKSGHAAATRKAKKAATEFSK